MYFSVPFFIAGAPVRPFDDYNGHIRSTGKKLHLRGVIYNMKKASQGLLSSGGQRGR
jgi:hypothetical protein